MKSNTEMVVLPSPFSKIKHKSLPKDFDKIPCKVLLYMLFSHQNSCEINDHCQLKKTKDTIAKIQN